MVPINFLHVVQRPPTDQIQIRLFHIFRSTEQMFQKYYIYLRSLIPLLLKLFIHYLLSSSGQAPALSHNPVLKSTYQDRPRSTERSRIQEKGKLPKDKKRYRGADAWFRCAPKQVPAYAPFRSKHRGPTSILIYIAAQVRPNAKYTSFLHAEHL
jgi:hypothetical protein